MTMTPVKIKDLPKGAYFKRKPTAKKVFIRQHFNRRDQFGPACYSCTDSMDIVYEIFLKPTATVYVD